MGRRQKINNVVDHVGITNSESIFPYTVGLVSNVIKQFAFRICLSMLSIIFMYKISVKYQYSMSLIDAIVIDTLSVAMSLKTPFFHSEILNNYVFFL